MTVPPGALGWDVRLTNITAGTPQLTIRRDLAPDEAGAPGLSLYEPWPSGSQLVPHTDQTSRYYDADGSPAYGRSARVATGSVLTNGTYYVGVFNSAAEPAAYTLVSRGIGAGYAIPVTTLNFSGAGPANTNTAGLAPREVDYYRVVVPSNTPSWHVRVTPSGDGELLLLWQPGALPNSYWNPYGRLFHKLGKESFASLASEGEVFLPAGTNYLAVVSEGEAPPDDSHTGTNQVAYRIESLGPVPVVDLGNLPLAGPPLAQHVSLEGGAAARAAACLLPGPSARHRPKLAPAARHLSRRRRPLCRPPGQCA